MPKIEEPMNPNAERDFAHAVREATNNFSEELKRIGEQMKVNADHGKISFIDFDDMPTEYSGVMRLQYSPIGAWQDVFNILVANGYTVTATVEDATETEREADGADKFVVIEYEEVE